MAAISGSMVSVILNATLPVGVSAGQPGSWVSLAAAQMKIRLNSGTSTTTTAGTELVNGGGYTTGGQAITASSSASSGGAAVTLPNTAMSWTNSSASPWTIASLDLTDGAAVPQRVWYGLFNGQPISVGTGNTFQIAAGGITVSLT